MAKDKSVGFCTFEKFEGRKNIGSSRIRAEWVANNWDEAEIYQQGKKYDVIIFQKCYWTRMAEAFNGIKIFDICDPDFLHWSYKTAEMLKFVDAVTTSTEALAEQFRQFIDKPVICIPDRIDNKLFLTRKNHVGRAKWVVWYGYGDNFPMLDTAIKAIESCGLNLIVISDKTYNLQANFIRPEHYEGNKHWIELKNIKWDIATINENIMLADMVINPKSDKGKWKFKSSNKTINAWAMDMPVAHDLEELQRFMDEGERIKEVNLRRQEIKEKWDIRFSVQQYKDLIDKLKNGRV